MRVTVRVGQKLFDNNLILNEVLVRQQHKINFNVLKSMCFELQCWLQDFFDDGELLSVLRILLT